LPTTIGARLARRHGHGEQAAQRAVPEHHHGLARLHLARSHREEGAGEGLDEGRAPGGHTIADLHEVAGARRAAA